MKKRIIAGILAIITAISCSVTVLANSKEGSNGHDQFMSMVLFGSKTYKNGLNKKSEQYKTLTALENAVAISIDQYNGNYSEELKALNKMSVHGIPKDIKEIDFQSNSHHRRYTHKGWNYTYSDDKGNWKTRKEILLQTVNKVFGFQNRAGKWKILWKEKNYGYDKQCEAFSELIYYVHILADIEDSGMDEGYSDMIKLALANPSEDSPDIYMELLRILPALFSSQSSERAYKGLTDDIEQQAESARTFIKNTPDLKNSYSDYQQYSKDLLDLLKSRIPNLLMDEAFFSKVFYTSK